MQADADDWDSKYAGAAAQEPAPPIGLDALLIPAGGLLLDVACGLGAQAVWAAQNGFEVVALDVSGAAVAATRRLAAAHGVDDLVDARVHDLDNGLPADVLGECSLVVCQRFRDEQLFGALVAALDDDGVLVITVLSRVGLSGEVGPHHAAPGDLAVAFAQLPVEIVSHHEAAGQATLVARRPEGSAV